MASSKGEEEIEGRSGTPQDCHYQRLKCIYLDDLIAAVHECHENFLLIKKNLSSINRQLSLRRCPTEENKLIRIEKGLVHEYAFYLQKAMKDVMDALEEHFYSEMKDSGIESGSQDRLWTLTEDLMSKSGGTGSNLLHNLANLVGEERQMLQSLEESYSLEEDLLKFKESSGLQLPSASVFELLLEEEQASHVRGFLRARQHETESLQVENKLLGLRREYTDALERNAQRNGPLSPTRLRDLKEDWEHGLDERLELVAMEAEAKCLEEVRRRLQEDVQSCSTNQETVSATRDKIDRLRDEVRSNQEAIRQLTRRNLDGRKRLEETRAEVQRLSETCVEKLGQLSGCLGTAMDATQRSIAAVEERGSANKLLGSRSSHDTSTSSGISVATSRSVSSGPPLQTHWLSSDEVIGRLARQVVSENEQNGVGRLDYQRLMDSLRSRSEKLRDMHTTDEKECASSMQHKKPLLEMAKAAMENGERSVEALEKTIWEKHEMPRALQLPRHSAKQG